MDNSTPKAYVLVRGVMDAKGNITDQVVGVTFNMFDADEHKNSSIENDWKGPFSVNADWQSDAEMSATVNAMRTFRSAIEEIHAEALR